MHKRSLAVAILLALFLGPIGVLYASFWAAVILLFIMLFVMMLPILPVARFLLFVMWIVCPYVSVYMILRHHKRHCGKHHGCCRGEHGPHSGHPHHSGDSI